MSSTESYRYTWYQLKRKVHGHCIVQNSRWQSAYIQVLQGLLFRRVNVQHQKNKINEENNIYAIFSSHLVHKNVMWTAYLDASLHHNTATTGRFFLLDLLLDLASHRLLIKLGTGC